MPQSPNRRDDAPRYRPGPKYVLMLGALAALPVVTTDVYLPSLPAMSEDLGASPAAAQLTISGMLLGAAIGQLVVGPLSDRYGRRRPLLVGLSLHVLISLSCWLVASVDTLVALRVVHGFVNAAAAVVAVAVIRDRFAGSDAALLLSRLMLVIGLAPLLAPAAGHAVAEAWQWRAIFLALAAVGLVLAAVVGKWMPETLPAGRRRTGGLRAAIGGYHALVRDRSFMALALVPGLALALVMGYVVSSPFVLQSEYGLTEAQFTGIIAVNGTAVILSSQVNAALVRRIPPVRILRWAVAVQLVLAHLLLLVVLTGLGGVAGVVAGLWLVLGMYGFVSSNAVALALHDHGRTAATAAALLGAVQVGVAGLVSPAVGLLGVSAVSMTGVVIACSAGAALVVAGLARGGRAGRGRTVPTTGRQDRGVTTGDAPEDAARPAGAAPLAG